MRRGGSSSLLSLLLLLIFPAEERARAAAALVAPATAANGGSVNVTALESEKKTLLNRLQFVEMEMEQLRHREELADRLGSVQTQIDRLHNQTKGENKVLAVAEENAPIAAMPQKSTKPTTGANNNKRNGATVAIMLSGQHDVQSSLSAGWKRWIVDTLAAYGHSSHAFICAQRYPGGPEGSETFWRNAMGPNVSSVTADARELDSGQYSRLDACYDMVIAREKALGVTFTHFLRGRTDMYWLYAPNFLQFPDNDYVYVRARSLINAKRTKLAIDALSSPWRTCLDANVGITKHIAGVSGDRNRELITERVEQQRAHMVQESVPMCFELDDQVALVPRKLAGAFFTTTSIEKTGVFKHPDDYTGTGSPEAIKAVYGPAARSFNTVSVCNHWNEKGLRTLEELYSTRLNTTLAPGQKPKYSTDRARCSAETCLTARVWSRLVPVKVVAIPAFILKIYTQLYKKRMLPAKGTKETKTVTC